MPRSEIFSRWSAETAANVRGKLGTAGPGQLIGVYLGPETHGEPGFQHPPALLDREGPLLHEDIAEARQPTRCRLGDDFIGDQPQVHLAMIAKVGWDYMRGQQRWHDTMPLVGKIAGRPRATEVRVRSRDRSRSWPRRS